MKKIITIILLIFFVSKSYSQEITKALFKNTSWFASNNENGFFTNDTIKLIKHNSCIKAFDVKYYCEDEEKTTAHKNIVEIKFKTRKINLIIKHGNGHSITSKKQYWKLRNSGVLEIKYNDINYFFTIVKINSVIAKTDYNKDTPTLELVIVRTKNSSILH